MYPDYMWDMVDSHTAKERARADKAEERASELEAKLAAIRERAEDIGLNEADMDYLMGDE